MESTHHNTHVADPIVVYSTREDEAQKRDDIENIQFQIDTPRDIRQTSNGEKIEATGSNLHGMSDLTRHIMENAVVPSTRNKYKCIEKKWLLYCRDRGMDPMSQGTVVFLNFLSFSYQNKAKWGYLKSFIPALTKYTKQVNMPMVRRLLRGVFKLRPPVARYTSIWDVNTVLTYLHAMSVDSFKDKLLKMATLLMILSGNRVNMLSHFRMRNMYMPITKEEVTFVFDEALKHSRPNWNTEKMTFRAFPQLPGLCPVKAINDYLDVRNTLSGDEAFFVTQVKPWNAAASDTIARWIKTMLGYAGIDSGKYTAHSCRSAVTSAAAFNGISLTTICKSASWSRVTTFKKHYLREISEHYDLNKENFGDQTLQNFVNAME